MMMTGTICLHSAKTSMRWVLKPNHWSAVHCFWQILKILEIRRSLLRVLNEIRSPSRNSMRMDSLRLQQKTVIHLRKLMPLWNLSIMGELSSSSKTLAMLEVLVRPMAFDILVINSTIPITWLNLIRTTFGCACKQHRVA